MTVVRPTIALLLLALVGCGNSSGNDDGPAVPDPGGPFKASIASDLRLDSLSLTQSDTICRDLANAYYTFLEGAVSTANVCGNVATELEAENVAYAGAHDGGPPLDQHLDAGGICLWEYAQCSLAPSLHTFLCPVPGPGQGSGSCDATVGDLSACLNELAASDPVGVCRTAPTCDAGAPPDAAGAPRPATPACDRVLRICPELNAVAGFPC